MASDAQFVLRQDQRDDVCGRSGQYSDGCKRLGASRAQDLWVIGTNLTVIQDTLSNLSEKPN
jgi:hypothetical protein